MADLRTQLDETDLKVFTETLEQGDEVTISEGPFMGIEAVVKILLPGRERVKLLLEFLGQPSETEVSRGDVSAEIGHVSQNLTRNGAPFRRTRYHIGDRWVPGPG